MRRAVVAGVLSSFAVFGCERAEAPPRGDGQEATRSSAEAVAGADEATPPRESKRGEGRGLADRVREVTQEIGADDGVDRVAIPASIPPGDIVIEHECSHSMQPFGTGYWSRTTTVDLARGTLARLEIEGDSDAEASPPGAGSVKRTATTVALRRSDVADIRDALDRVLSGGPYAPVYAVSEGIVCTLSLRVGEDTPFFRIDKSGPTAEDAVTRLIKALGVSGPEAGASPP